MKSIISILAESPFYFSLSLRDRYALVKRLRDKEQKIDLSAFHRKITKFLKIDEPWPTRSSATLKIRLFGYGSGVTRRTPALGGRNGNRRLPPESS